MRAGKDSIASLIAAYAAAFTDYRAMLRPGEAASVLCLACDRDQAKIVLKYTKAHFQRCTLLRGLVRRRSSRGPNTEDGWLNGSGALELSTGAELTVATRAFRSIRGRSVACCIFDEVAYWRDESSAVPDVEVYNAVKPATATIPNSMIVGISSPYKKSGLLYQKWRDHFGRPDDEILVIHAPTRTLNPLVNEATVARALEVDPGRRAGQLARRVARRPLKLHRARPGGIGA